MINKILLIAVGFLAILAGFFYMQSDSRGSKIATLTAEKTSLNDELKGCQNEIAKQSEANERANSTIGEIKTIIKTVKSPCDCYNSPIDDAIIDRVRGTK